MQAMKPTTASRIHNGAFTLVELLTLTAVGSLLLCVLASAHGDARVRNRSVQCLGNLMQIGRAWLIYADDYQGRLARNTSSGVNWVNGWIDYSPANRANWDPASLTNGLLSPYIPSAAIFRCPSDPSTLLVNGERRPRVRSYSMNNFVGEGATAFTGSSAFQTFHTRQSLGRPAPSQLWVVLEEHPDSLNDGVFFTNPEDTTPRIVDLPAAFHASACNFLFADGRAGTQKWLDARTMPPISTGYLALNVASPNNQDILWLQGHATERR